MLVAIGLPIIGIPFQHNLLAGKILLQPEGPQPGKGLRCCIEVPLLRKPTLFIRLLQQMTRKNGKTIEQSFGCCIRLCEIETYGVSVKLCDRERLSVDYQ